VCAGGFTNKGERTFAFLDVFDENVPPLALVRAMRNALEVNGQAVDVLMDGDYPSAPKLLTLLGFVPHGPDLRIWTWQPYH
jgi:hypothetical protein